MVAACRNPPDHRESIKEAGELNPLMRPVDEWLADGNLFLHLAAHANG
jgi:hypothetical protein